MTNTNTNLVGTNTDTKQLRIQIVEMKNKHKTNAKWNVTTALGGGRHWKLKTSNSTIFKKLKAAFALNGPIRNNHIWESKTAML